MYAFFFQPGLGPRRSCRMYFYAERVSGRKATGPLFGGYDRYLWDTNYELFQRIYQQGTTLYFYLFRELDGLFAGGRVGALQLFVRGDCRFHACKSSCADMSTAYARTLDY